MSAIEFIVSGMLAAATPFLLAALGELIVERSGVLNLGLEGMMALAAAIAFIVVHSGYGHGMAFFVAAIAGTMISLLFGLLVLGFRANQVAAGLAIGILGLGLSALIGKPYESLTITGIGELAIPGLSSLPLIGGLFSQDPVVWMTLLGTLVIAWMFRATKLGMILRAVGENPHAAHAIGIPVISVRLAAISFGGLMAGLAGAYASIVYTPLWADGMIAGRG
jgi:simple sugar transport system permease protein